MYYIVSLKYSVLICFFYFLFNSSGQAQGILNCHFSDKNNGSFAISYTGKSYDKFYRGDQLTEGNPADFGKISSNIVSLYGEYSLTNWLTGIINIPFISVKNENEVNDPIHGENKISGLQDLSLYFKAKAYQKETDAGTFTFGAGVGLSMPLSGYVAGSILSIGNRATAINGILLVQYMFKNGLILEMTPGYSSRSEDVPNALIYDAKIAYAHSKFYLSLVYSNQNSSDGIDIGGDGFAGPPDLPKTKVNYNVLDFNLYVPVISGGGVTVGYGRVLGGRNVGKESYTKVGLAFSF